MSNMDAAAGGERQSGEATHVLRVLVAGESESAGKALASSVEQIGLTLIGRTRSAAEGATLCAERPPDLLLVDVDAIAGIELLTQLMSFAPAAFAVVVGASAPADVARAVEAGVYGYLIRPAANEALAAQIAVAAGRHRDAELLRESQRVLRQSLDDRKSIERAKGILMKRLNLDENEAHRRLQTESQKRRIGIAEIARRLIESEKLLGG